jgi:hypothetical protein
MSQELRIIPDIEDHLAFPIELLSRSGRPYVHWSIQHLYVKVELLRRKQVPLAINKEEAQITTNAAPQPSQ